MKYVVQDSKTGCFLRQPLSTSMRFPEAVDWGRDIDSADIFETKSSAEQAIARFPFTRSRELFARPVIVTVRLVHD